METTNVQVTSNAWVQLVADTDSDWIIQNSNAQSVLLKYASAQPASDDDTGLILSFQEGLTSSTHGVGNIWCKMPESAPEKTGNVSVTK